MTENEIKIKEFKNINLEGGYLIDGFPSKTNKNCHQLAFVPIKNVS